MTNNRSGKPSGRPQKPVLRQDFAPAFIELARRVSAVEDPALIKAAQYLFQLGTYLQSEEFIRQRAERARKVWECKQRANGVKPGPYQVYKTTGANPQARRAHVAWAATQEEARAYCQAFNDNRTTQQRRVNTRCEYIQTSQEPSNEIQNL